MFFFFDRHKRLLTASSHIFRRKWYQDNYHELKLLNPNFPLFIRTTENAWPAVATELDFLTDDVIKFMLQTGRFRDENGLPSQSRISAARDYLKTDWEALRIERWKCPGFDPEHPLLEDTQPEWREDPKFTTPLAKYLALKDAMDEQLDIVQSGPNDEYLRSENALLMCQRVDLWCAGPKEVERAVQHLIKLGKRYNDFEVEMPDFITEFYPGVEDF